MDPLFNNVVKLLQKPFVELVRKLVNSPLNIISNKHGSLAKKCIQLLNEGQSKYDLFNYLSKDLDYDLIDINLIKEWFNRFERADLTLKGDIDLKYYTLVSSIISLTSLHYKAIYKFKQSNKLTVTSFPIISGRYLFLCKKSNGYKFVMLDCYTGTKRTLKVLYGNEMFRQNRMLINQFVLTKFNLLILKYHLPGISDEFFIALFKVDFNQSTCIFLNEKHVVVGSDFHIVLDQLNPLVFSFSDDVYTSNMFKIVGDQLQHKEFWGINPGNLKCRRFIGDKYGGFLFWMLDDKNDDYIEYYEYDFRNYEKPFLKENIEIKERLEFVKAEFRVDQYTWHKDICFFSIFNNPGLYIYGIDVEEQRMFYTGVCIGQLDVYNLCTDDNGILFVETKEYILRYSLRRPDSLETITWFNLRRRQIFEKSDKNDRLVNELAKINRQFEPFSSI